MVTDNFAEQVLAAPSLADLDRIALTPRLQARLDEVIRRCNGAKFWCIRKQAEAHALLALSQLASRLVVVELDLRESLRVLLGLRVAVGCRPRPDGPLVIEDHALLSLTYREEALRQARPGYEFVQILRPQKVWHSNVSFDDVQALCLGAKLPAGVRVKDLVLLSYVAIAMQSHQFDEFDTAGVLNREAALWWQARPVPTPLSGEPFRTAEDLARETPS